MVILLVNIDTSHILLGLIMAVFTYPLKAFPSFLEKASSYGLSYKALLSLTTFKLGYILRSHVFLRNPHWAVKGKNVNLERGESRHPTHHTPLGGVTVWCPSAVSICSRRVYTSDIPGRCCSALAALLLLYCSPEASGPGFISHRNKKKKPLLFSSMLFCWKQAISHSLLRLSKFGEHFALRCLRVPLGQLQRQQTHKTCQLSVC